VDDWKAIIPAVYRSGERSILAFVFLRFDEGRVEVEVNGTAGFAATKEYLGLEGVLLEPVLEVVAW